MVRGAFNSAFCVALLVGGCGGGNAHPDGASIDAGDGALPDTASDHTGDVGGPDGGGMVVDEQTLINRVYAEFNDSRLPATAPRVTDSNIDGTVMLEVARRFPSLSAQGQAILDPFLRPPGDSESWFATHLMSDPLAFQAAPGSSNPRCGELAQYQLKATAHTNIWFRTGDAQGEIVATALAADVERIYTAETTLFGRFPPSDLNVTNKCNGGDGALDIYVVPIPDQPSTLRARTVPYGTACGAGPSFIELNSWSGLDPKKAVAALAHEFFHTLQVGAYTFAAACSDYDWLGEATANWAIDHVFPDNQTEVPFAAGYMAEERKVPIDEAFSDDSDHANGYSDYVFFEYMARKSSPAVMRTIWDATEGADSVAATAAGMAAAGGAKDVWSKFAVATWNDATAGVQNQLAMWDSAPPRLDWGMKKVFDLKDAGGDVGDPSTAVDLKGAPGKTFKLAQTALTFGGGVEIPRLSIHADYLKFTDANVRSVVYVNVSAIVPDPNLKIQAMVKKGGTWGAPEDWSDVTEKSYCRDVTDERVEELVLFYSNSDTRRPSEPILWDPPPLLSVSNVGCWRWQGSASVEEQGMTSAGMTTSTASATGLVFERWRPQDLPDGAPGREIFQVLSGSASGMLTAVMGCTTTESGSGAIDMGIVSSLQVDLGLDFGMGASDRAVIGSGSTELPSHNVFSCPGSDPIIADGPVSWNWMEIPLDPVFEVNADGTIQGTNTRTTSMAGISQTRKMTWMLTPVRQ